MTNIDAVRKQSRPTVARLRRNCPCPRRPCPRYARPRLGTGNADLATRYRLPSMTGASIYPEAGCLMSYGTNFYEHFRRVGYYVDRIFKGAKPADLPFEQPTRFELVINARSAKALGLTIPQALLISAGKVIE